MAVRVVTDSTADLPAEVARELDITVVPLTVHFGEETFYDGVDITAGQFFDRLRSARVLPRTSQPSVGAFQDTYQRLAAEADGIVSVHISSRLSGTCNAASLAAEAVPEVPVRVVDSQTASLGLGIIAMEAARAARAGADLDAVVRVAESTRARVPIVFTLDTLEYLARGGRIGRASAFMGTLLNIKPILTVDQGEIAPLERVRTRTKALDRLCDLLFTREHVRLGAVAHAQCPEDAEHLVAQFRARYPGVPVVTGQVGPVIGVYTGPGAVGLCVLEGERGEA
ncbi:MAG TPA: DegV family protein [Dehalococcoidia bacterium]